jgi:hypothetical protein
VLLLSNDERYQAITTEEIRYSAAAFLDSLGER